MAKTDNTKPGSVYPFLDMRTPMANSPLWPVKLTVNIKGQQFRVGLKLYSTQDVFDKAIAGKGGMPKEAKILKDEIDKYLEKAKTILKDYPNANKAKFIKLFKSEASLQTGGKSQLSTLFQDKIDELIAEDNAGSKSFYEEALKVFCKFRKNPCIEDVDVAWLKAFKAWYMKGGNSKATVQIHLRSLRHIYNRAIKAGVVPVGLYPFKEYKIGTTSKSKDVIYPEQIKQLLTFQTNVYGQKRAKDYWFFLYLSSGMNIKDALSLKGENLKGDVIRFVRSKTSETKADVEEIIVYLHPMAKEILQRWGDPNTDDYLFPCFRGSKSDIERKHRKDVFARCLNRSLREIGEELGFEVNLITNLARHSFATKLNIDGFDTSMIKDSMGHSSTRVTEHYMKTLPLNKYKKISDNLLDFSNE
ncbi:tyrosine-type recombinase/integrase [Polluticoccus soli]|uniref:tyrosine-type recombinase/integrase n=1 Tax=Polluticoccus soli TaxID=3034150 RepID=UPI0023E17BDC|nr:site-specific integrase [Flavipsychrobacter sp. JY13-12]